MKISFNLQDRFIVGFHAVAEEAKRLAESKGWKVNRHSTENLSSKIALMHSELSEALESLREGNPPSKHIPDYSGMEEEFADVIIRIMHVAEEMHFCLPEAILAKMEFNETREYKHGGKSI